MIDNIHKFILDIINKTDNTASSYCELKDLGFFIEYFDNIRSGIKGDIIQLIDSKINEPIYYIQISETIPPYHKSDQVPFVIIQSNDISLHYNHIRKLKLKQIRNDK